MKYNYHFTPYKGWMNDPNGLIYYGREYHMYFQYNPDSVEWGNISWGHAVSWDLVNWRMEGVVLRPDEHGLIFSGSAIAEGDRIYYFYTAAKEGHFTQRMAVSTDGGYTLVKNPDFEIATICPENRDPKIFYHKESEAYIICLWLEKNDFAILRSEKIDGDYKMTQRFTLPEGFECPNLFELEGTWFIWTADGYYYPGSFDGYEFHWNGVRHEAYNDKIPYAAQIFSGTRDIIMVPWLKTPTVDNRWTGMMGIPRKLKAVAVKQSSDSDISQVFSEKSSRFMDSGKPAKDFLISQIPAIAIADSDRMASGQTADSDRMASGQMADSDTDTIVDGNVTEITNSDMTKLSIVLNEI